MTEYLLSFEACNPHANIYRWYNVLIGTDLFGDWYILTSWGRKGRTGGQKKKYALSSSQDALKKAIIICRKRFKATSRIGCNYICINHALTMENLEDSLNRISNVPF